MHFKIDWASLIVGSKFTIFALFYFVFDGNFPSTSPRGTYIWRRDLTEGFLRYRFGGLVFGGAYFQNFTVISPQIQRYQSLVLLSRQPCVSVRPKLLLLPLQPAYPSLHRNLATKNNSNSGSLIRQSAMEEKK